MTATRRPVRAFWFVGLALLLASAAGASILLNRSDARVESSAGKDTDSTNQEVVCLGYVDVEPGVTPLYPVRSGVVLKLPAEENKPYRAGALLLQLDDRQARATLEEAEADLRVAQEQLAQARKLPQQDRNEKIKQQKLAIQIAKHQLKMAEHERDYRKAQAQANMMNRNLWLEASETVRRLEVGVQLEEAKLGELNRLDVDAKARLAQREVAAKEAKVRLAQLALEDFQVKAPATGEVLRVLVNEGETLGAQPKQAAILFCPNAQKRLIRAEVEQEYANRVKVGNPAIIEDDTRAGDRWTGKVVRLSDWYAQRRLINQEPTQLNDVRTLECLVAIDALSKSKPLRIGQRMRVRIRQR